MPPAQWNLSESDDRLVTSYMEAKTAVIGAGFAGEVDWQDEVCLEDVDEQGFLREAAWVILSSGMRHAVISRLFPKVSRAFLDWTSAQAIVRQREKCRQNGLSAFAHEGKVEAILSVAGTVALHGFDRVRDRVRREGVTYLQSFPYLGPATSRHLAKNLGLGIAKPDRHLVRVSKAAGFRSPDAFCARISELIGEKPSVVDVVVWRYATLQRDYLSLFRCREALQIKSPHGRRKPRLPELTAQACC